MITRNPYRSVAVVLTVMILSAFIIRDDRSVQRRSLGTSPALAGLRDLVHLPRLGRRHRRVVGLSRPGASTLSALPHGGPVMPPAAEGRAVFLNRRWA